MNAAAGFDRLAWCYRALEYLAFGRALERARFVHLDRLRDCRSILVLGEGDGRCLARLVQSAPQARIECLDLSSAMLARAARRLAGTAAAGRVVFRRADLLTEVLPPAAYDAVVTFFFLDCFTAPEAEALVRRIHRSLRPGARWLWADFSLPVSGWRRSRARVWVAVLYACFRWQTGLSARELPPAERLFGQLGCLARSKVSFQQGLVHSVVWECPDDPRKP